jgi:hypothetical protein
MDPTIIAADPVKFIFRVKMLNTFRSSLWLSNSVTSCGRI